MSRAGRADDTTGPTAARSVPAAPPASAPLDAGLRLIAESLDVPAALLFASDAEGGLEPVAVTGTWKSEALVLPDVAGALGPDALDISAVIEGARFAAADLGDGDGMLVVFGPEDRAPDEAWNEVFAASATLAHGLLRGRGGPDRSLLLHEIAVHPGTFSARLAVALERAAEVVGADAAAFARIEDGLWIPEATFDPDRSLIPTAPLPLSQTVCSVTCMTDGAVGVEDVAASSVPIDTPAAYLGAPVFVGGRCVGTLSVVAATPRSEPFPDEDRVLVESLARWAGSALSSRGAARRLADHETTLRSFFNGAPMGMGVVRLVRRPDGMDDLELVTVNAAGAAIFGGAAGNLVGRLVSRIGLDDDVCRLWLGVCHRALDGAMRCRFETTLPSPDGTRAYAVTVATAGSAEEGGAAFTFVIEDVTDLRDAVGRLRSREAELEALVSEAPVALFTADADGRLTSARGRGIEALGLDPARALGQPLADRFEHVAGAAAALQRAYAGEEVAWAAGADDRTFECRLRPLYGKPGQVTGILGVAIDVTDRERAETAQARARRAAEAVAQGRSALLTHVDRRVRSPLTSILGYADLLDGDPSPSDVAEVRSVIDRAGRRLLTALDDLQDLALLDGAPLHPHPAPTDLAALVEGVVEESRPAAESGHVALNLWCSLPDEDLLIDAGIVERIARSLVGGAVASPAGARVDVRLTADGDDWVSLRVTGGATDREAGALGIGPDLTHRLVEAVGGSAREVADPQPGWVVRLPRRSAPPDWRTLDPALPAAWSESTAMAGGAAG